MKNDDLNTMVGIGWGLVFSALFWIPFWVLVVHWGWVR